MTAIFTPRDAAGLRERLAGRVILPGQEGYDAARHVWNASHDYRPALIAQPLSVAEVQAAVRFAADRGLPVSVRGGGHNHAGYAVADGALMLDLSAMVSVRVDPARRVATVSGGATWGTVDQATQRAGLAVTGADVSPVGVGGVTLGGGVAQVLVERQRVGGDELFLRVMLVTAPPAPFIPEPLRGRPAVVLSAAWFGTAGRGESALRELREFGPQAGDLLRPMSYVQLQSMQDAAVPRRVRAASGGGFTGPLDGGVIEAVTSAAAQPPPMSMVELQPMGGAVARISPDATAFRYRRAAHLLAVLTAAPPEDPPAEQAAWAEKVDGSLPAGTILGPSVHAMGRDEPEDQVRAAYGAAAYARLTAVKHAYDPGNLFRFNQNIRPQAQAKCPSVEDA